MGKYKLKWPPNDFCCVSKYVYAKKLHYCPAVFQEILQECYDWEIRLIWPIYLKGYN